MMKKQRIRRQRTLILCLLFLSVVAPIVFFADRLSRLPRSLDRKSFAEDGGGIEAEDGLKEPDRVVYSVGDDSTVSDTGNGSGVNAGGNKMPLQKNLSFDGGKGIGFDNNLGKQGLRICLQNIETCSPSVAWRTKRSNLTKLLARNNIMEICTLKLSK
ncbi:putative galacturonosyltransferase 5 [Acorus calamus]|uniref:Galacturonosyltransferase 5 n=1 Tax=Acorus calamus TaxID=4465 RepID=A0AAV9EKB6_ACOCL|nr:putative galacturonosyltransferase 5 [Acorus calamus]